MLNQKVFNIEFDKKFKNYNFIIEQILKFKAFAIHLHKYLHVIRRTYNRDTKTSSN